MLAFFGIYFNPGNKGDLFLRTVSCLSLDHVALYPRKQNFHPSIYVLAFAGDICSEHKVKVP
jgi:hypothetical protein